MIRADDISFLSSLPQLRSLSLEYCDCNAYSTFTSLKQLRDLKLLSIYGDIPNLNFLNQTKQLKSLDLSSLRLYDSVESIFAIPKLESLNISECSIGLDFSKISKNPSLKVLKMNNLKEFS